VQSGDYKSADVLIAPKDKPKKEFKERHRVLTNPGIFGYPCHQ
jgi:hypothetical protein